MRDPKEIIDLLARKRDEIIDARIRAKEGAAHNFLVSQGWDGVDTEKAKEIADKFICEEHPDGTITFREKTEEEIASEELLPCPCCGNYNRGLEYSDPGISVWYVRCQCGLLIGGKTKEEVIKKWNRRPSVWHTGTPTEDGMYICKVFYGGDEQNDIRILEWVGAMDCFCLPNSDTRIYHFYVGENGGKETEVVYEWLKLDLRFRMEQGVKWLEPTPIYLNSSIRGTLEDCLKAAKKYGWN